MWWCPPVTSALSKMTTPDSSATHPIPGAPSLAPTPAYALSTELRWLDGLEEGVP